MGRNRQAERYAGFHVYFSDIHRQWVAGKPGSAIVLYSGQSKREVIESIQDDLKN